MFLWALLKANPVAGLALLAALATLFWCLRLIRQVHTRMERYMMGFLGLIAMYQGLHILQAAGFFSWPPSFQGIGGAVDMSVSMMCLACALILQVASRDQHTTKIQLRMVEADQAAPRPVASAPPFPDRTALSVFGLDEQGSINLWHNSSEDFFGWRREEVIGTRLPFKQDLPAIPTAAGAPQILRLRTRHDDDLDVLAWFMPVPGASGSLVLVMDSRKARKAEPAAAGPAIGRAELSAT